MFFMMINQGAHPLWDGHMRKRDYYELISDEFDIKFPEGMSEYHISQILEWPKILFKTRSPISLKIE